MAKAASRISWSAAASAPTTIASRLHLALQSASDDGLMETLRHWLNQPQPERWHVIYAPAVPADEETVRKALTTANERVKLMPELTKTLLSEVGQLPRVIADLIVAYEPPDFYEGFYCYSTVTNFWKHGDNSKLVIACTKVKASDAKAKPSSTSDTSDQKELGSDPNILVPSSIVVSRDLSECLNVSVALSASSEKSAALVIVPQAKVVEMMARANLSHLLDTAFYAFGWDLSIGIGIGISAERKSEFITRLLQVDVLPECWSEVMDNGDLQRLLTCAIGQTTYNLTLAGKAAIRRFVETVVYSNVLHFCNDELHFGDFLVAVAPDSACDLVTRLLRHQNRWIHIDAPPPLLRPSHAAVLVSLFFTKAPGPICSLDEKRLLFDTFISYLPTCGIAAPEIR
jgi:hypothetical protein